MFITFSLSFLFDSLMITFFGLAGWFTRWQVLTSLESMVTPASLKILWTVSSKLLFEILSGIPDISRHSRLEHCLFAAQFFSRIRFCFTKLSFTLLVIKSWDSIFANMSLKGFTKLHFMHYSRVVIILFSTALFNSVFCIYSFGKTS